MGTASDTQQQHVFNLIVEKICGTYDASFHPDHPRWTDFAEGKRFVGNSIVKLTKINATPDT